MVRILLPLLCLVLSVAAGCVPLRPGGTALLPASQIEGAYSRQAVVGRTARSTLLGQVLVLRQDGAVTLTAEIGQTWTSGEGRLRFDRAFDAGRELPFRRVPRFERFCTGAGACQGARTGVFLFTAESFARAAREGYPATLIGPDAVVEIVIPARLFVEAQARARVSGLWRG